MYEAQLEALNKKIVERTSTMTLPGSGDWGVDVESKLESVSEQVKGMIHLADTCKKADIRIPKFEYVFGNWKFIQDKQGRSLLEFYQPYMGLRLPFQKGLYPFYFMYPETSDTIIAFVDSFLSHFKTFEKDFLRWIDDITEE